MLVKLNEKIIYLQLCIKSKSMTHFGVITTEISSGRGKSRVIDRDFHRYKTNYELFENIKLLITKN